MPKQKVIEDNLTLWYYQDTLTQEIPEPPQSTSNIGFVSPSVNSVPLQEEPAMNQLSSALRIAIVLVIVGLIGAGLYILSLLRSSPPKVIEVATSPATSVAGPTILPTATATLVPLSPTEDSSPKLPNLLADIDFPTQPVDYPADWPNELHYPKGFVLVEANSDVIVDGGAKAWAVKLLYNGNTAEAAQLLTSFLRSNGWQITQPNLDSGGILLTVERNNKDSGIVVIAPNPIDSNSTRITSSVFL